MNDVNGSKVQNSGFQKMNDVNGSKVQNSGFQKMNDVNGSKVLFHLDDSKLFPKMNKNKNKNKNIYFPSSTVHCDNGFYIYDNYDTYEYNSMINNGGSDLRNCCYMLC